MKFAQIAQAVVIVIAAFAVYGFVATAKEGEARRACSALCALKPDYAGRNRTAPDFELPSMTGGKVRLSSLRGKAVVLNFWTKTCRPCLEEMPSLATFGKAIAGRTDVVLVTITTDESAEDARATLSSVLGTGKPPFIVLIDPESSVVHDQYGTTLFPETWFIDPSGAIRARFDGPRDWSTPLPVDLVKSFLQPMACDVHYAHGKPTGEHAGLCADLVPGADG